MKTRKSGVLAPAMLAVVALSMPVSQGHAQGVEELNLRFASFLPETMIQTRVDQWFADEIEERSSGKIQIRVFTGGAMGKPTELLELVSQGGIDIATTSPAYFPSELPFLSPTNSLPLVFEDAPHAQKVNEELYKRAPALQAEMREHGLHPLFWHALDPYYLICRTPVRTLEDLKGKRIRSWGEDVPRLFEAVGAVPVSLMPSELYESLHRGSVDCTPYSLDTAVSLNLHEVAKYVTLMSIGSPGGWPQFYNLEKWESWSPETQELFKAVAKEAKEMELRLIAKSRREARDTMEAAGVEFIEFPDQQRVEAMAPDFLQEWVSKMEKMGKGEKAAQMAEIWRELR